jgi:hypothetical protein
MQPRAAAAGALCLLLGGCLLVRGTASPYVLAPSGLERREESWRRALEAGDFDSSLARLANRVERGAPDDALLRMLYQGLIGYYARSYATSAASLERAYELSEDRFTKSASRGALSLLTNDRVLVYEPGHTERLLIHYYAMLDYLVRDSLEGAAVEARRLGNQLERFDERRDTVDASTRAVLRYLAGAVFEAAGETNDADVAYRNARALAGDSAFPVLSLLPPPPAPRGRRRRAHAELAPPSGEVVVVVEHGFVAHRVAQTLVIALAENEVRGFADKDLTSRMATRVSDRVMLEVVDASDSGVWAQSGTGSSREYRTMRGPGSGMLGHELRISWPVYRRPRHSAPAPTVLVDGEWKAPVRMVANVSDAVAGDYKRERAQILARTVARAAAKAALAKGAQNAAKKKCDDCGWLAKVGVRTVGNALERADLRSWHLLPGEIGVARFRLPPGKHTLTLDVTGDGGQRQTQLPIGQVEVREGEIVFATQRVWCDEYSAAHAPLHGAAAPLATPIP